LQNPYLLTHKSLYGSWQNFLDLSYVTKSFLTSPVQELIDPFNRNKTPQTEDQIRRGMLLDFQKLHLKFDMYVFKYFFEKENIFSINP